MIRVLRADQRYHADFGWQKSWWLFSFSTWQDPANEGFGCLRVFNEDLLAPGASVPAHTHRDMEVVTFVLSGTLVQEDAAGGEVRLEPGGLHVLTSGTGVSHLEYNPGSVPARSLHLWFLPETLGLAPASRTGVFQPGGRPNELLALASGRGAPGAVPMRADATLYTAALEPRASLEMPSEPDRLLFVYVLSGSCTLNGVKLLPCDQARLTGEDAMRCTAGSQCALVVAGLCE